MRGRRSGAILVALLLSTQRAAFAFSTGWQPVPNPESVVTLGDVRLSVIAQRIVRIQKTKTPDDRPTLTIKSRFANIPFKWNVTDGVGTLSGQGWTLHYDSTIPSPSAPNCSVNKNNTDQVGGTRLEEKDNLTLGECCAACQGLVGCDAYVFQPKPETASDTATQCFLMSNVTSTKSHDNRVFGSVRTDPFPAGSLVATVDLGKGESGTWRVGDLPTGNLKGVVNHMDCYTTPAECFAGYISQEADGILSRDGWALLDDTRTARHAGTTSSDGRFGPWLADTPTTDEADWYLILGGRDYIGTAADFASVSGRVPLLPRAFLEPWWSRHDTLDKATLSAVFSEYVQQNLSLGAASTDMQWHVGGYMATPADVNGPGDSCVPNNDDDDDAQRLASARWDTSITDRAAAATAAVTTACAGWGGWTWNATMWPQAGDWVGNVLHNSKQSPSGGRLSMMLNVHPQTGIDHCQTLYPEFARAMGVDPATNDTIPCDFQNHTYASSLFGIFVEAKDNSMSQIDAYWPDWLGCGNLQGNQNMGWSNFVFGSHQQVMAERRPFQLSRRMGLGDQNLPMAFSGDTFQAWDTLAYQVNLTSRAASAALQLWSHDIGMFHREGQDTCVRGDGNVSDPLAAELYLRSLQAAVFWPAMRTHCRFCERRVWLYEHYSEQMMAAMRLRHALLPTLYSGLADWAIGVGPSPIRAVFADYPAEDRAYVSAPTQFQWGRPATALIISPITQPQDRAAAPHSIWLPAGRWCTFTVTDVPDCSLQGPSNFTFAANMDTIPAVAQVGTLLSMQDGRTPPAVAVGTVARWAILGTSVANYPEAESVAATATLFEDDGISLPIVAGNITTIATSVVHIGGASISIASAAITAEDHATAKLVSQTVGVSRRHDIEFWGLAPADTFKATIDGQTIPECATISQQAPCWFMAPTAAQSRPPQTTIIQVELPTSGAQSKIEASW